MFTYHHQLIHHVVKETPKTIIGLIVITAMFLFLNKDNIPSGILVFWFFLQTAFIYIRSTNAQNLKKHLEKNDLVQIQKHTKTLVISVVFSTMIWNFAFFSSIFYGEKNYEFIAFMMAMGITTASVVSLSAMYSLFMLYFILMFLPMILYMFYLGEYEYTTILMYSAVFIPTILVLARSFHNYIIDSSKTHKLLEEKVNELHQLSITDPLTKLYNRRYFFEITQNMIELSKRNKTIDSLLMIDIDFFKKINDTYGHKAGDFILQSLADHLRSLTRGTDVLARIGGEEFALFLNNSSYEDSKKIAQKICDSTSKKKFVYNDTVHNVTLSIGLSSINDELKTIDELYEESDKNLYIAKTNGRNMVV